MTPEQKDLMAAEYVLGTLPFPERQVFEKAMARNPLLLEQVAAWQQRLAPLGRSVRPVDPPAAVWARLATELGLVRPLQPVQPPPPTPPVPPPEPVAAPPPPVAAPPPVAEQPTGNALDRLRRYPDPVDSYGDDRFDARSDSAGDRTRVERLEGVVRRWRVMAVAAAAVAAGLAAFVAYERLMPPPLVDTGRYVAVVDREGAQPAMIVMVDTGAGIVTVRTVAAVQPIGRSLELWHIADGASPVSLGVLEPREPVTLLRASRGGTPLTSGTLAVTEEPLGGSGSAGPSGPVIYSGALIAETP